MEADNDIIGFIKFHHWLYGVHQVYKAVPLKCSQFSPKLAQNTSHNLPVSRRYGMYFVG